MVDIPYDELDANIVALVRAINSFPGIFTVGSCGGHPNNKDFQNSEGTFDIVFRVEVSDQRPTQEGWLSLEFLVYIFNNVFYRTGVKVFIGPYSAPPHYNEPGSTITFRLGGEEDPDEIAELLQDQKDQWFMVWERG